MALMITDACINCGVCEPECPNGAIQLGEEIYFIRAGKCTECVGSYDAPVCVSLCPISDCIIPNPRRVETRAQLEEKARIMALRKRIHQAMRDSGL
mgnify:CR=1 FL=1